MNPVSLFHDSSILPRRKAVLANSIGGIIADQGIAILDVGCGDGEIAKMVAERVKAASIEGVETRLRGECKIPVSLYDGKSLPHTDASFDYVLVCDVLHHDKSPDVILKECKRVAKKGVVIKDHFCETGLDRAKLRMMDWVGNRHHNVHLEYNYLRRTEWQTLFVDCGLQEVERNENIPLYTGFLQSLFGVGLHFISKLHTGS